MTSRLPKSVAALAAAAVLAAVAAIAFAISRGDEDGSGDEGSGIAASQVMITVDDSSFEISGSVEAGPVSLTVQNDGTIEHTAAFTLLHEDATSQEVREALRRGRDLFELVTVAGNVPPAAPGETSEAIIEFLEGTYFVVDPENDDLHPAQFEVAEAGAEVANPDADEVVELGDFFIEMPASLPSGSMTVAISNVGSQSHEFVVTGKGEKKGKEVTSALAPAPGATAWLEVELEPGVYEAACYLPDVSSGQSHAELGMTAEFTVD